ncbi:hypothetical protein [Pseudobdellovibrio sp. HCB154]|uniref:hypothetical protein n=1 Tax=Pseudobdellovibrio sp. HCB154 TaxID=3386277 RepID=UPI003917101C
MKKLVMIVCLIFASCTKKEESQGSGSNFTSEAVAKISAVSSDFTPESLNADLGGSSVGAMNGNPCQGTNGLVDCQPNLLKLYLAVSKQQLDMVASIVSGVGAQLGQLEEGASGTVNEDGMILEYSKTDSLNWSITIRNASNSNIAVYVLVANNSYTLELNFANFPPEDGAPTQGSYQSIIDYTDADTWSMTSTMLDSECNPDDVRAPQNIRIAMSKGSGLWKGKAMLYHPRWAEFSPDPTCATTPSDANGLNMFSDFVGDNTAAKMNVYMVKRTRAANAITSHPLSDICNEYVGICDGGGQIGTETPASYPNSVCVEASNGAANWNSDCSAVTGGSSVAAASFGPAGDWIAPSSFYNMSITVGP